MQTVVPVLSSLLVAALIVLVPATTGLVLAYVNYKTAEIHKRQDALSAQLGKLQDSVDKANGNGAATHTPNVPQI